MENTEEANWIIKEYGNSAIAYCIGRMHGTTDVIDEFKNNSSTSILNDWEDEINELSNRWKKIIRIIKSRQKPKYCNMANITILQNLNEIRIIEKQFKSCKQYVIQKRYYIFFWKWIDTVDTLEEAQYVSHKSNQLLAKH